MAKELPYFRFTVTEWLNGDISMEDYETQGVFINICSFYWFKDCSITLAQLKQKFSNAKANIKHLLDSDVIKYNNENDFITIEYLDEQYDILSNTRKKRQEAGRKGGESKSSKAKAKLKQKPSYKDKYKDKDNNKDNIDEIYKSYPSKCPIKESGTGKSQKDKEKIEKLLENHSKEDLIETIEKYVKDCTQSKTYLKNFSTFLNNLPDYSEEEIPKKEEIIKYRMIGGGHMLYDTEERYLNIHKPAGYSIDRNDYKICN